MTTREILVIKNINTGWTCDPFISSLNDSEREEQIQDRIAENRYQWDHEYEVYSIGLYNETEICIEPLPDKATAILVSRIGKLNSHKNMADAMKYEKGNH